MRTHIHLALSLRPSLVGGEEEEGLISLQQVAELPSLFTYSDDKFYSVPMPEKLLQPSGFDAC
jgi:hypothetical protein